MMRDPRSRVNRILAQSLSPSAPSTLEIEPSEWETLWLSARDHCLVPYLHKRWTETGVMQSLPPDIARRFSAGRMDNTERNRRILLLLDELGSALRERGIATLVSKGLPLAHDYYGDLGLRVMYDLDLHIKPEDTSGAFDVLRRIGYAPFFPRHGYRPGRPLWRPREYAWDAERVFDPDRPVLVELHTRPWEPRWHGFRMESRLDLWRDLRVAEIAGVLLQVPAEERLLVHLAVHYACNVLECNARLMHLLDIALLLRLRGRDLDWDAILREISESCLAPFCFVALALAESTGGCNLSPRVRSHLRDATPSAVVSWLASRGLQDACSMNLRNRDRSLIYFLHWNMAAKWPEKIRVLFYSLRSPWLEGTGMGRVKSFVRRMGRRLQHLARVSRT